MVEAANRGPVGAGLSNSSTYVTPQELRIQGEGSKGTCKVKQLQWAYLVSWSGGFFVSKNCKQCC